MSCAACGCVAAVDVRFGRWLMAQALCADRAVDRMQLASVPVITGDLLLEFHHDAASAQAGAIRYHLADKTGENNCEPVASQRWKRGASFDLLKGGS
jgi:hypothetical protein